MLAGVEALQRLRGMHLGWRAEDHGVEPVDGEAVGEVGRDVRDAVLLSDVLGLAELAPDQRDHLDAVDQAQRVEVLDAECPGSGERNLHRGDGTPSPTRPTFVTRRRMR